MPPFFPSPVHLPVFQFPPRETRFLVDCRWWLLHPEIVHVFIRLFVCPLVPALWRSVGGVGAAACAHNLQCAWHAVPTDPQSRALAVFSRLSTQSQHTAACVFDWLSVTDVAGDGLTASNTSTTLQLCGVQSAPLAVVGSSALLLQLTTDRNIRSNGFDVSLSALEQCVPPGLTAVSSVPVGKAVECGPSRKKQPFPFVGVGTTSPVR